VFCDASEIGFGGHLTTGSEDEPVKIYGSWSREEQAQSSTWREFEAVNRVLRNVINKLNGKFVRVYTDNKNVTHIIRVGSRKNILHSSLIEIHELCMKHSIKLSIVWIPREANDKAEASKRIAVKPNEEKEPISPELCNMFKDSVDLLIVRDLAMILLSFSGFLRYDEVSSLRFSS
jgi:ribonuclease HI